MGELLYCHLKLFGARLHFTKPKTIHRGHHSQVWDVQGEAEKNLEDKAPSMALTMDICTSMATEAYMTVTAHYIDPNRKLQNFLLETLLFPERHTGVNIAQKLNEVGERWRIISKVIIVSHDQTSNMEAAMETLTEE